MTPELSQPPQITAEGRLRLVGLFPTHPLQIQFEIWFEPVQRQWRLSGLAVNTAAPSAAADQLKKADRSAPVRLAALNPNGGRIES